MSDALPLADRLSGVAPSATIAISTRAREMREAGLDVIALSAGQPDFATPAHVCEAAAAAMARGETGYTNVSGTPELKAAIRAKLSRDQGLDYADGEILVCPGGKAVIANAFAATLSPGDEVVVPAPYWVSYPDMARLSGGEAVVVPGGADFKITPAALAGALTAATRWVVLNSPSNPTGAVYSRAEFAALGEVLEDYLHVRVLSDDIYEHIVFDAEFASFASACPHLRDRTLVVNGVSKAYAMTGWRIGYGAGERELIAAMTTVQGQTTSCACSVSQAASVAALEGPQGYLEDWRATYRARRDLVVARLNALPGVSCDVPEGAFYVFARIDAEDDAAWCARALEEARVALVPGSAFGAPGHVRLSYAAAEESLVEAMDRLEAWLA